MSAQILHLDMPTLSQALRADTEIGQQCSIDGVLQATGAEKGRAPAADLILAALRQIAALRRDSELAATIDRIDDLLC